MKSWCWIISNYRLTLKAIILLIIPARMMIRLLSGPVFCIVPYHKLTLTVNC